MSRRQRTGGNGERDGWQLHAFEDLESFISLESLLC
ncbi:hypothetical protein WG66_009059, partial [Moniliophthora roreri]